jgi:hypothetical protein
MTGPGSRRFASAFCLGLSADDFKKAVDLADRATRPKGW